MAKELILNGIALLIPLAMIRWAVRMIAKAETPSPEYPANVAAFLPALQHLQLGQMAPAEPKGVNGSIGGRELYVPLQNRAVDTAPASDSTGAELSELVHQ